MAHYDLNSIQCMLQKDLEVSQELLSLLKRETPSIQQRDYNSVKQILADKAPLLDQLKQHANIRKEWLSSLHKAADRNDWVAFLSSFNTPQINQQWEEIENTIEQCKSINETNGLLIARSNKTYSHLLSLLRGDINPTELYTSNGDKRSTRTHYTVTRA